MNFASDNVAGISPEILAAIEAANRGAATPYGGDDITARLEQRFADLFEHEVTVYPVATGTAANVLALAALTPPWGAIYCHEDAHIANDECGAPEFFTGGAKLVTLPGEHGKLSSATLAAHIDGKDVVHHVQPAVLSITQQTEAGTLYKPAEVAALSALMRQHGLALHMDGARFANAIVGLGCTAAEVTWRAGVDALSFGATKNGALAAEVVIFFDKGKAAELGYRRKRGGHLVSKQRFISAQLDAYLTDDLWLRNARHANAMAARLAAGLAALPGTRMLHPVEGNEVFVELPESSVAQLNRDGFGFYRWGEAPILRLVTAFDTRLDAVDAFIAAVSRHATPS